MDGRARGIDVSHWDGQLDWTSIATTGINFAITKASDGSRPGPAAAVVADAQFANNWAGIQGAGLIRGAYHFIGPPLASTPQAQWNDDIHRQVDFFLSQIGPLQSGDLPPTLDIEAGGTATQAQWKGLIATDRGSVLAILQEFINYTASQLNGVLPMLYVGDLWRNLLGDPDPVADSMPFSTYPLWQPVYPTGLHTPIPLPGNPGQTDQGEAGSFDEYASQLDGANPRHMPKVWGGPGSTSWTIWQFTEYGKLSGQNATFDLNVFNGSTDALKAICIG